MGGLYNSVFGTNVIAPILVQLLGLEEKDFVRFRDAFVVADEIVVYSRAGGNNRRCWHMDDPESGLPTCKHHTVLGMIPEMEDGGPIGLPPEVAANVIVTRPTGRTVEATRFVCEEPDSEACGCVGCAIRHRLPKHPLFLRSVDDTFDTTYASIFFRIPEDLDPQLRAAITRFDLQEWNPDKRWKEKIASMK